MATKCTAGLDKTSKAIMTVFKYVLYHEYRTKERKCDWKSENPSENWGGGEAIHEKCGMMPTM
jgi:hypothetical protein